MQSITVAELEKRLENDTPDDDVVLIDVREPSEHKHGAIPKAENIPMDKIDEAVEMLRKYSTIYVHCRTGGRSSRTCEQLKAHGLPVINVEGGVSAWEAAGFPLKKTSSTLPMMRQVFLVAGILVLLGVVLAYALSPYWILLSAFVGAGLVFSGATGWCGMTKVLAHMPWNK